MARCSHHLTIPSRTSELARVRRCVLTWATEAGLSETAAQALQLAVDEACANAIEHGYEGRPDGRVEIEATLNREALIVTVRHHGAPFDPAFHRLTALDTMRVQRRIHGYGLHLMQRLVDSVVFRAQGTSSEVCLTKRRNGNSAA